MIVSWQGIWIELWKKPTLFSYPEIWIVNGPWTSKLDRNGDDSSWNPDRNYFSSVPSLPLVQHGLVQVEERYRDTNEETVPSFCPSATRTECP
jgi:hypothetical protein